MVTAICMWNIMQQKEQIRVEKSVIGNEKFQLLSIC
jgi:hypothetical protein